MMGSGSVPMTTTNQILENAERLLDDALYLHAAGKGRSAAALAVIGLEQFGAFLEAETRASFPDASAVIGIFGSQANAHAKRQDALAANIMNFVLSSLVVTFLAERYVLETGARNADHFLEWAIKQKSVKITDEQKQRMRESKELRIASILLDMAQKNRLKSMREFGFYANSDQTFSQSTLNEFMDVVLQVRQIFVESRKWIMSETIGIAGINMSTEISSG